MKGWHLFHRWERWSEPFKVHCLIPNKGKTLPGFEMVQQRTCRVCGLVERREAGAPKVKP
jgi:hypothetical protein